MFVLLFIYVAALSFAPKFISNRDYFATTQVAQTKISKMYCKLALAAIAAMSMGANAMVVTDPTA